MDEERSDRGPEPSERRVVLRKTIVLTLAVIALAPVLWYQHHLGAVLYLAFLAIVHLGALVVFAHRVKWRALADERWGFVLRLVMFVVFGVLLGKVAVVATQPEWFWWGLGGLWALHVLALATLHFPGALGQKMRKAQGISKHERQS